jgi:GDP-4-dehydro-6-deoxy-D-mannose reductase
VRGPILVTGAAGFAGGHLLDLLLPQGLDIEAWRRPDTPDLVACNHPGVRWHSLELLDRSGVYRAIDRLRPGTIFHCAGAAHVGHSWQSSRLTLETNVLGTHHVLEADRRLNLQASILIPGSATVYRASEDVLTEESPLHPESPYAVSKLAQEDLALRASGEGQHVFVTRSFNHIGPRQSPAFAASSFARQVALAEIGQTPPILRAGNLEPRRDTTDVRDTVGAYAAIVERGRPGVVYNVCSGRAVSGRELVDGLRARASVPIAVEIDPALFRPHDTPLMLGDFDRLRRDTGWSPRFSFDDTLDELLGFWRIRVRTAPQSPTRQGD